MEPSKITLQIKILGAAVKIKKGDRDCHGALEKIKRSLLGHDIEATRLPSDEFCEFKLVAARFQTFEEFKNKIKEVLFFHQIISITPVEIDPEITIKT